VALAVGVHGAFHTVLPGQFPFLPFAAAVLIACRWAGGVGGVTATLASAFILRFWILPPGQSVLDERNLGMWLFLAAGGCVSWQSFAPHVAERTARPQIAPVRAVETPATIATTAPAAAVTVAVPVPVEAPMFEYAGGATAHRRAA
jgi:hypothetical protein